MNRRPATQVLPLLSRSDSGSGRDDNETAGFGKKPDGGRQAKSGSDPGSRSGARRPDEGRGPGRWGAGSGAGWGAGRGVNGGTWIARERALRGRVRPSKV